MKTVLLTPSWLPDLERCRFLVESARRFATGFSAHYLVVDAKDAAPFRELTGDGVELLIKEDILPAWLHHVPMNRKWWWSTRTLPVRGWIVQQVVKFAVAAREDWDAVCFADSDVFFVDEFAASSLWRQGDLRLYRDERKPHFYADRRYRNWYAAASRMLDLGDPASLPGAYIAQLVTMRSDSARRMCERIEAQTGLPWMTALLRTVDFSEYIVYGTFVEHVEESRGHFMDASQPCHSSWFFDVEDNDSLRSFLASKTPEQVAVLVQSNLGIPAEQVRALLEDLS